MESNLQSRSQRIPLYWKLMGIIGGFMVISGPLWLLYAMNFEKDYGGLASIEWALGVFPHSYKRLIDADGKWRLEIYRKDDSWQYLGKADVKIRINDRTYKALMIPKPGKNIFILKLKKKDRVTVDVAPVAGVTGNIWVNFRWEGPTILHKVMLALSVPYMLIGALLSCLFVFYILKWRKK
jgi:hypothetical protein